MQENNNFESIISTWRRMSAEQGESVVRMSGDSPDYQLQKKKDEESKLLVPEKVKDPIPAAASAGAVAIISEAPSDLPPDHEEKLLTSEKEESKEAAGDGNKDETDYLQNKDVVDLIALDMKHTTSKVDAFINSPLGLKSPPTQSANSNPDEDDCIVKCLYYTLQCCDCVII